MHVFPSLTITFKQIVNKVQSIPNIWSNLWSPSGRPRTINMNQWAEPLQSLSKVIEQEIKKISGLLPTTNVGIHTNEKDKSKLQKCRNAPTLFGIQ